MLKDIAKDIISRFGSEILKWALIALAVFMLGMWLKSCAPWTKVNRQQATIERQKETINDLVQHTQQEAQTAANDRAGRDEAKDTLVQHLDNQVKDEKKFDEIIAKIDKNLIPPPAKPVKKPVVKPKPKVDQTPTPPDPEESTAEELAAEAVRTQHNARILQQAVWDAYQEAVAMSSRAPTPI